ncbi:MAG: hypothetical protein WAU70_17240 [Flavobacteriales bacterium]
MIHRVDLVLAYMPPEKRDFVSTKFNEIACLHTPILHIGEPGGLSRHIIQQHLGDTMPVDAVAKGLLPLLTGERRIQVGNSFDPRPYLLSGITDRLLRDVIGARR